MADSPARPSPCDEVRDLLPELAFGVAPGDERARALSHVGHCEECRELLERTAALADDLMLVAPEREPPAGFEARVLAAMQPRRRRRWGALAVAAALVVVALGAAGVTRWAGSDDRHLAQQYRHTLQIAHGTSLRAGRVTTDAGRPVGDVFGYQGRPSWIFVTLQGAPSGTYAVRLVTHDGKVRDLGSCWVQDGAGSWGTAVDVPMSAVYQVELQHPGGTLTADLSSWAGPSTG